MVIILVCYLTSLGSCVVWLASDQRWAAIFALAIGACGAILHVAESLVGGDGDD